MVDEKESAGLRWCIMLEKHCLKRDAIVGGNRHLPPGHVNSMSDGQRYISRRNARSSGCSIARYAVYNVVEKMDTQVSCAQKVRYTLECVQAIKGRAKSTPRIRSNAKVRFYVAR